MADYSLKDLIHELAEDRNLDLRGYKQSTLERRIRKRMFQVGAHGYQDYLDKIRENPGELNELLNTVLINVTEFFRDPQAWEAIRAEALPRLLHGLRPGDSFRAWSAGCASGEEPFSLAILLSDYFGDRLHEYDVKIYATDIDEQALSVARRGEYNADQLRRIKPEWRAKYFTGEGQCHIARDVRRLVIFGRSNLVSDAPISHCSLVVCRNVLIYFDQRTQQHILARLHYALESGGVLFLGKAESKLSESDLFRPVNPRWRIFVRLKDGSEKQLPAAEGDASGVRESDAVHQELKNVKLLQHHVLGTLRAGVIALNAEDVVSVSNDAAVQLWGLSGVQLVGKRIHTTEVVERCPELVGRLEASRRSQESITFTCPVMRNGDERTLEISIKPVTSQTGERSGTVVQVEDVTAKVNLQNTIEQLESTSEELQSANEELETTNEELQSTNEELETTNEELQSTNEELETTNEELQSLNEELENMNDELEFRSRELNVLSDRYAETLKSMPWPVLLVDTNEMIQIWNAAAQKMFGIGATPVVGLEVSKLPLQEDLRRNLVRRCRSVLASHKSSVMREQVLDSRAFKGRFDVHFTPVFRTLNEVEGVLCVISPVRGASTWPGIQAVGGDGSKSAKAPRKANTRTSNSKSSGRGARKNTRNRTKRK